MDKKIAVSLPRIQWNSAEHLNKLENSVFVYSINLHILNPFDTAYGSLIKSLIEYSKNNLSWRS